MFEQIHNSILLYYHKVSIQKPYKINGKINIFGQHIKIGKNLLVNSSQRANPIDGECYTCICTFGSGEICIGDNVGISNSTVCAMDKITIGNNVLIGGGTCIWDTDFHPIDYKKRVVNSQNDIKTSPIVIEDDVFIGAHSIILKGVKIGRGAVIGAGAVVTCDVPSYEVWAGNPAKCIKRLGDEK